MRSGGNVLAVITRSGNEHGFSRRALVRLCHGIGNARTAEAHVDDVGAVLHGKIQAFQDIGIGKGSVSRGFECHNFDLRRNAHIAEIIGAHGNNACHIAAVTVGVAGFIVIIYGIITVVAVAVIPHRAFQFSVGAINAGVNYRHHNIAVSQAVGALPGGV